MDRPAGSAAPEPQAGVPAITPAPVSPADRLPVLVWLIDAAEQPGPYFAGCHRLCVYDPPEQVRNDWNKLPIGVCTGPSAPWRTLWPHLKHYE